MVEEAAVEKILERCKNGDIVLLKKVRPDACHHCNGKILCGVKNNFTFKAINKTDFKLNIGDIVEYRLPNFSVIKLSFIVYSIPLLVFLLSIISIQMLIPSKEYLSLFISLILMFTTFLIIGWIDRKTHRNQEIRLPKIEKKIEKDPIFSEEKTGGEFF